MKKILVQLIGDQTLPNILPVLAIRPDVVVNIYTEQTRLKHLKITGWFEKYGDQWDLHPLFLTKAPVGVNLSETQRGIEKILRQQMEFLRREEDSMLILNMTGGTKLMSACAMSLSMQISHSMTQASKHPVPLVYLNPKNQSLEFVTCAQLQDSVIETPVDSIKLSVEQIIYAGGDTDVVSSRSDWQTVYPAAQKLLAIADSGIYFSLSDVKKDNYEALADSPISSLLSDFDESRKQKAIDEMKNLASEVAADEALRLAFASCGLVARDADFYFADHIKQPDSGLEEYQAKKNVWMKVQGACNFFVGGWWEVIVAHAYWVTHPNDEILWSVETAASRDHEHPVETDIIASDGQSLCLISCKRGLHEKVTQELEQHCMRSFVLGGVINKRILAMYRMKNAGRLRHLLRALNLDMWNADMVKSMEAGEL